MIICGIDEVGRGPIAGPLTAAAVILPSGFPVHLLADSKKLSAQRRMELYPLIVSESKYGIGWVWPEEIDTINIHNAALLGMRRAFANMHSAPDKVLVDGKFVPAINVPCEAIIKGDNTVPEIQAASIIAKCIRDQWMVRYSWIERDYDFEKHKGYPTKDHRSRCLSLGLSCIHRRSFRISFP